MKTHKLKRIEVNYVPLNRHDKKGKLVRKRIKDNRFIPQQLVVPFNAKTIRNVKALCSNAQTE